MKTRSLVCLLLPLLSVIPFPAFAQDVGRVSPASLPLPLPTAAPMPPDQLRAHNPWNLPMTGVWRFQLTYGQVKDGHFQPSAPVDHDVTASSSQPDNPPSAAFDGSNDTRWCATSADFPQWLQADLGRPRHVTGATLAWEFPGDHYGCRIEGRLKGGDWKTLADETAGSGIGDGPVTLTPADVRYVRITVTDTSGTHWASLREFGIQVTENGQEVAWRPPAPPPVNADVSPTNRDAFASPQLDDTKWDAIPVASNWEMLGYSLPTYDSVDNTVGLYRRFVTVPAAWAGRRIFWHFDGALDGAEVFINGPGGAALGTLATTYEIRPDAEMVVGWTLNWTADDTSLWEEGLKFALPAGMTRMAWQRDSYFTDYPAGHLGEPSGTARAGDTLFRASKRGLHWLTLTDGSGVGLALLPTDVPLVGRADMTATSMPAGKSLAHTA